jgi:hypothetical protein
MITETLAFLKTLKAEVTVPSFVHFTARLSQENVTSLNSASTGRYNLRLMSLQDMEMAKAFSVPVWRFKVSPGTRTEDFSSFLSILHRNPCLFLKKENV